MIENRFISYRGSSLHYVRAGRGTHPLLFFHGFGQDHSVYLPLIQTLAPQYKLYIFDLFFHGKSAWACDEAPLKKKEWEQFMNIFLKENKVEDFSLVGYSMGGKFALATIELFAPRVKTVFLIAPDGIKTSLWYSMATYPFPLRKFFKGMIHNYQRFEAIARTLSKSGVVDHGLVRFADYQMGTVEKRKRVYYSWVVFRHLKFNLARLAKTINAHAIRTTIITGKYDKVISPENIRSFAEKLQHNKFIVLESGHSGLIFQSLPYITIDKSDR